jgi:hypothetical protein
MIAGSKSSIQLTGRDRFYAFLLELMEECVYSKPVASSVS